MKIRSILAAGGFAVAIAALTPALSQDMTPRGGMHPNDPQSQGPMGGPPPSGDMGGHGSMGHGPDDGRGPGMGAMPMHDDEHGGSMGMMHHRHCHWVWHHHHKVRRCM